MKTKYFSPLFGLAAMAFGYSSSDYSHAITNTNTSDDVYSDSLYITRSSAEVPSSFESSGRKTASQEDSIADPSDERVLESLSDLDEDAPAAKSAAVKNNKKKKSSRN